MSTPIEILEAQIMCLGQADRTRILERLIHSLDQEEEVEASWMQEALQREAAVASGESHLLSGAEVLARLKAQYT